MHRTLSLILFLSGVSALVFETLWFRMVGLTLGNSVWSASLVLAAFMAGIALGNAAIARLGSRVRRPIRLYAYLEVAIGVAGLSVVLALPGLSAMLGGALEQLTGTPWLLNATRLLTAFIVLSIPAVAMGATLPVLTEALSRHDRNFGAALGRLYGWNTLGATLGALLGELLLIKWLGVTGSGMAAMALNLIAAAIAMRLSQGTEFDRTLAVTTTSVPAPMSHRAHRFLAVAFLSGAAMLALEVVWFRFLLLGRAGTGLLFAIMLATVLAGIAIGGLIAARLYRVYENAHDWLVHVIAASGACVVLTYFGFDLFTPSRLGREISNTEYATLSLFLMLPVSLLSGAAFTMCGRALKDQMGTSIKATGILTFANTVGAMLGSLVGAFVLLPILGMEKSFFALAVVYGVMLPIVPIAAQAPHSAYRTTAYASVAAVLLCLALFPFGLMQTSFLRVPGSKFPDHTLIETREGLTETASYYAYERFGEPAYYRLITNGHSMSGTGVAARRYMKAFVYLPVAVSPSIRDTLLISFGTGSTAKALTDTSGIRRIDIVDISKTILDMSSVMYSDADNPLNDERVDVHVEDGRFFLNSTTRRYDLITAEPPPPALAGIANLYSEEFFEMVRDHLNPGGYASYWLPVYQLEALDSMAVVRAFCNAFDDCSLWSGSRLEWILMGSNNAERGATAEQFSAQWRDPAVNAELVKLGFEEPEQLGALFIADAAQLEELTANVAPLTDNFPLRITERRTPHQERIALYDQLMEIDGRLARFMDSTLIDRIWPDSLRQQTEAQFEHQKLIDEFLASVDNSDLRRRSRWEAIDELLTESSLETLPLWLLGSTSDLDAAVQSQTERDEKVSGLAFERAVRMIAARDFDAAAELLDAQLQTAGAQIRVDEYLVHLYALARAERLRDAAVYFSRLFANPQKIAVFREFIDWYGPRFGIRIQVSASADPNADADMPTSPR
jgi:spermidine synthase